MPDPNKYRDNYLAKLIVNNFHNIYFGKCGNVPYEYV